MKAALKSVSVTAAAAIAIGMAQLPAAQADDSATPSQVAAQVTQATKDVSAPDSQPNPAVVIPTAAGGPVTVTSPVSGNIATLAVPSSGTGVRSRNNTTVYDGQGPDNQIAVQPLGDGVRALISVNGKDAPESYDFALGGAVDQLQLQDDGSVKLYDASGQAIGAASTPWAVDANGASVPTHYEVHGTTLTQVVEHRAGDYAYGITADPGIIFWVKCGAAVALFIAENGFAESKILRVFKDAKELVKLLKTFKSVKAAVHGLTHLLGELSGIDDLVSRCMP